MATLAKHASDPGARALWSHWNASPPAARPARVPPRAAEAPADFLHEIRRSSGADEVLLTVDGGGSAAPAVAGRSGHGLSAEAEMRIARGETGDPGGWTQGHGWDRCRIAGLDWRVRRIEVGGGIGSCAASLTLLYRSPMLEGSAAGVLVSLRPLIESYLRLWLSLRAESRASADCRGALDAIDLGVLLLDRGGLITFENRTATRLLDAADPLRRNGGGFTAANLKQAMAVQVALSHGIAANGRAGAEGALPRRATIVALRSDRGDNAVLLSLVPSEQPALEPGDVAAVAYLVDSHFDAERQLGPICRLLGLSPVETRLVCQLTGGRSLQESAAAMRIKDQTARSYLKQIFLKTDTRRQADLVRTMLSSLVRTERGIEAESLG